MKQKSKWFNHPTKNQFILVLVTFTISFVCLILVITDLFTKNPFHKGNLLSIFLMLVALSSVISFVRNYRRNKKAA